VPATVVLMSQCPVHKAERNNILAVPEQQPCMYLAEDLNKITEHHVFWCLDNLQYACYLPSIRMPIHDANCEQDLFIPNAANRTFGDATLPIAQNWRMIGTQAAIFFCLTPKGPVHKSFGCQKILPG